MSEEKRMIQSYEVKSSININGTEVIYAEDNAAAEPYMVCDFTYTNPLIAEYAHVWYSADYLAIITEYSSRIAELVKHVKAERAERGISDIPLTAADCIESGLTLDLEGQMIVIKPECLTPAARTADYQILFVTGGFGCKPNENGKTIFCKNVFTGETENWKRYDVAGIIATEKMPDWAAKKHRDLLFGLHHLFIGGTGNADS